MFFRRVFAVVLAMCLAGGAATALARADKSHTGDIFAFRLVGGVSAVDDVSINSGTLSSTHDSDQVGGLALAIGYDWSKKGLPFRSEIEYTYRFRFDFDARVNGGTDSDFENDLSSHALMVNVFYDFETGSKWIPFVGAGIGWVRHVSATEQTKLLGGAKENRDDEIDNFAWSLNLGLHYKMGRDWAFEASYRYINMGEVSSGPFSDGAIFEADSYEPHDIMLGIVYRF
jgi:outer membrane immunogenic protein